MATNGFVINGIDAGDQSGRSASGAGDVNGDGGDGIDDLIVGASGADPNGNSFAGESYVVFGQSGPSAASLDLAIRNSTNGFVINGIDTSDFSGRSVSGAGDVNGDGIDDLIVGATGPDPNGNSDAGASCVVFGRRVIPEPGSGLMAAGGLLAWLGWRPTHQRARQKR